MSKNTKIIDLKTTKRESDIIDQIVEGLLLNKILIFEANGALGTLRHDPEEDFRYDLYRSNATWCAEEEEFDPDCGIDGGCILNYAKSLENVARRFLEIINKHTY